MHGVPRVLFSTISTFDYVKLTKRINVVLEESMIGSLFNVTVKVQGQNAVQELTVVCF